MVGEAAAGPAVRGPRRRWRRWALIGGAAALLIAGRLFVINVLPPLLADDAVDRWRNVRFPRNPPEAGTPYGVPVLLPAAVEDTWERPGLLDGETTVHIVDARVAEDGALHVTVIASTPADARELWVVLRVLDEAGRPIPAVGGDGYGPDGRLYAGSSLPIPLTLLREVGSASLTNLTVPVELAALPPDARPDHVIAEMYVDRVRVAATAPYALP